MSRNSKNAKLHAKAREMSALHLKGEKGPSKTTPLHNKRWGYRDNPEVLKRIAEANKAANAEPGKGERTAKSKILAKAGGASKEA